MRSPTRTRMNIDEHDPVRSTHIDDGAHGSWLVRTYRRRHGQRKLLIGQDGDRRWLVYEIAQPLRGIRSGLLVEVLTGREDGYPQARALAEEYLACQAAYRDGQRSQHTCPDPLPKAKRVPVTVIGEHARRARLTVTGTQPDRHSARSRIPS